jgi:hypothetical protein
MPTSGKAAAKTALPQPPKVSQKVPMNSAAIRFERDISSLLVKFLRFIPIFLWKFFIFPYFKKNAHQKIYGDGIFIAPGLPARWKAGTRSQRMKKRRKFIK